MPGTWKAFNYYEFKFQTYMPSKTRRECAGVKSAWTWH